MDRLMDLGGGDRKVCANWWSFTSNRPPSSSRNWKRRFAPTNADEVRHVAHSCAGASATLGMTRLVPLLRELERQGNAGQLTNAEQFCAEAAREFRRIQDFLAKHPALAGRLPTTVHP